MNLTSASVVLRERSSLEVADLSLRFIRALSPVLYLRLGAFTLLPAYLLCVGLRYVADLEWGWVWLTAAALCVASGAPFTVAAGRLLFARTVTVGEVLGETLRRSPTYATLQVLRTLFLALSALTLIGPFVVAVQTVYLPEVVLLEGAGVRQGLGRASRFLRGRSGAGLEMLLLLSCAFFLAILLAELIGQALVHVVFEVDVPFESLGDGGSIFALAGAFLAVPFASTFRFLSYINERTLRDGWDVQVRFMGIRDELEQEKI